MSQKLLQRRRDQRLVVLFRLRQLERMGNPNAANALADFKEFHGQLATRYVTVTGAKVLELDEGGTPILDSLLDFIKWMYESGFLEILIGWFSGVAGQVRTNAVHADTTALDQALKFLAEIEPAPIEPAQAE